MKRSRIGFATISLLLVFLVAITMNGCTVKPVNGEHSEVTPAEVNVTESEDVVDFAIRLFKAGEDGKNTLISPLSVFDALAMVANGAEGETLAQMEAVLGMSKEEMNLYLYNYIQNLTQNDQYSMRLANSIWYREGRFTAHPVFLQKVTDYYGADVYKVPFTPQTVDAINQWVDEKTNHMIPEILDEIPSNDTVMYLINALVFEAEWVNQYDEYHVGSGIFTREDGARKNVQYMYSEEDTYLTDHLATGFVKYYKGNRYAFIAMLPNEGVSVADYVATLDGESLRSWLTNAQTKLVKASIPKFEISYDVDLLPILQNMGIVDAFDAERAAFGALGKGDICISRVLHKTFISVSEWGTKAGAVTVLPMYDGCLMDEEIKEICLNRPFVYMLVDCETCVPIFVGTAMDIGE